MKKLIQLSCEICQFCIQHPKEAGFSALLLLFSAFAIYKSTPAYVPKVFQLKVIKNGKAIKNINDKRDPKGEKTVWVDRLDLKDGYHLSHPKLGRFGFDGNYFIDIEDTFTVKKAGKFFFYPGSDDGFSLYVNGKRLCQFARDRAYSVRACPITLEEGEHSFKLSYFQGGGHSGLTLAYRHVDEKKRLYFGDNSRYIKFH